MNYVSVQLQGGLGNLMFQIAAAYSLCARDNKVLLPDASQIVGAHYPLNKYTSNIFRKIQFSYDPVTSFPHLGESGFHFTPIPQIENNIKLFGFFQSEKYFIDYSEEIRNLFDLTEEIKQKISRLYGYIDNHDTCFIHVRRGNYLSFQHLHPVLDVKYYKESVSLFDDSTLFLVFSNDIAWCEQNFDFIPNKIFIKDLEDYEELHLMALCKNGIIANSTFSWWGAWLSNNKKKVIAPKIWFGSALSIHDTKDLYCENWLKL